MSCQMAPSNFSKCLQDATAVASLAFAVALSHEFAMQFTNLPPLSRADIDRFTVLALTTATDLIHQTDVEDGPIRWTLDGQDADFKIYKGEEPMATKSSTSGLYCGIMNIQGTLEEVIDLFRTDTTEMAKEYCQRVGKGLVDAVNLYTLATPSSDSPTRISLKWILAKSALDGVVRKRDGCVLECDHLFYLPDGRRGWVRSFKSVPLACCPNFEASLGYIRVNQRGTGHVFIESDRPGYVQAAYLHNCDTGGHLVEWLASAGIKKRCENLVDIDRFLRENRLSRGRWLSSIDLLPLTSRKNCFHCQKQFGLLRKPSNCRQCGQVVCGNCNVLWNVKIYNQWTRARACVLCSVRPCSTRTSKEISVGSRRTVDSGVWHVTPSDEGSFCVVSPTNTYAGGASSPHIGQLKRQNSTLVDFGDVLRY
ncbi:Aste57867_16190 [Aphanomyces stellatus]|uniref:Aste57867_16190 protein n=1 Tax=Aphanomyces stellatus TaxID=120398 RepID=A0A485L825_9STRA|nr:hypothetical protein As57867_016134 [Aphanomyces stellatus]VFT92968.1 Aste57867_16190 [Aphanomyces stellatus]